MSAKLEEIILDLNRRITELESTRQKSYSSPFELNSVAHGKNTARRINVNDQHYIDADGTANLKSVSLDDGGLYATTSHASTHRLSGSDQLFNQNLNTYNSVTFAGLSISGGVTYSITNDNYFTVKGFSDNRAFLLCGGTDASTGATIAIHGNNLPSQQGNIRIEGGRSTSYIDVRTRMYLYPLTASTILELDADRFIISATKNSAYNKNFGAVDDTVCQGNDSRLSDARVPLAHGLVSGYHTVSGLTVGHFLKATGTDTFGFAAHGLTYLDVGAAAAGHNHDDVYATITNVFGGLSQNYIPLYNSGFINSPLFISGSAVCIGNASGPSAAPTKLLCDKSLSNGITKDKLKISLYEDVGGGMYGFTIGSTGDIQYHSDVYHDFYINNAPMMRLSGSRASLETRLAIAYNSVGTNFGEGTLELIADCINFPQSYPLIGFLRMGIDAMSLVYTGGITLAVRSHADATLYSLWHSGNLTGDQTGHYHDSRYYTETELTNGTTALSLSSLTLYGVTIASPDYYTTNISQTLTGSPPFIYPQLNIYTPGHLNLYADRYINVNSIMIMAGGTYCTLRSISGDLGAQNLITIGGCGSSTTISVDTYVGSFFRVTSGSGFLKMVTSRVGRCILIKNSSGTTIDLCPYSNRTDYIFVLGNTQSVWAVCTQTDGTNSNWDFFQSVVIPEP